MIEGINQIQETYWKSYIATGRRGKELFKSIDTDGNGLINVGELETFLHSIHKDGINDHGFDNLISLAKDHELDLKEFLSQLVLITQSDVQSLKSIKVMYNAQPSVGMRSSMVVGKTNISSLLEKGHVWNEVTMAQNLRKMQYAVRGEVVLKASELKAQGREIVFTNIGNPHAVGQKPITFYRQVLALCDLPAECGVDHPNVSKLFPEDVIQKAKEYRAAIGSGGTGAYSNSQGVEAFRKKIAAFIADRDGHPAFPGDIFITNGASAGIQNCLTGLISSDHGTI